MNIDDINKEFTKHVSTYYDELEVLGEKLFREKVLPKIKKAIKNAELEISILFFSQKKLDAVKHILLKKGFHWREYDGPPFFGGCLDISGWKTVPVDPNDIMKEIT